MNRDDQGAGAAPTDNYGPITRAEVRRLNDALLSELRPVIDSEVRRFAAGDDGAEELSIVNGARCRNRNDARQEAAMIVLENYQAIVDASSRAAMARTVLRHRFVDRYVRAIPKEERDGSTTPFEAAQEVVDADFDAEDGGASGIGHADIPAMSATLGGGGCFDDDRDKGEDGLFDRLDIDRLGLREFIARVRASGLDRMGRECRRRREVARQRRLLRIPQTKRAA